MSSEPAMNMNRWISILYITVQARRGLLLRFKLEHEPAMNMSLAAGELSSQAVPLPVKPELQANLYWTASTSAPAPAALQPPLVHLAADQVPRQFAGMGYHVMHHHHPSQAPATMTNYGYEYADPAHAQMYYSQAGSPPALAPHYQTVSSAAVIPDSMSGDVKQARTS